MASYTSPSISGYNSTPPSDDGSETSSNEIDWSTIKEKLADPVKTYADAIDSAATSAFTTLDANAPTAKYARLAADVTINNTTSYTNSLTSTNIPSGAIEVTGCLYYTTNASADLKCFLYANGGIVTTRGIIYDNIDYASLNTVDRNVQTDNSTAQVFGCGTSGIIKISGYMYINTGLTSQYLRWTQNSATVVDTVLKAGSWIKYVQIGS